jgi:hypothetical protein
MRKLIGLVAVSLAVSITGCDEQKADPAEAVGKYVIHYNPGTTGSIRMNTVTGETFMLIPSDTEIMHNGVLLDGKPLVWRKISNSQNN